MRRITAYPSVGEWVRDARAWLQMQRLTYPAGALNGLVRFTENHDTIRSSDFFGVGPSQALTALCVFAQGTPMIYQDQEIGFGEDLKEWLNRRSRCPELSHGDADYEAVRCSAPEVLVVLRRADSGAAVVAVNFAPREVEARLSWPREVGARFPLARLAGSGELVSSRECSATVRLPAYRPAVILLRNAKTDAADERKPEASTDGGLILAPGAAPVGEGVTEYRLRLAPAGWWFVNTGEGLLFDRFVDRHTAEPAARYQRLWRPLEAGLWDGPGDPAMGVIAADGRGVVLSDIAVDALAEARIEDPSGRGEQVELVLRSQGDVRPFEVTEVADGWAAVKSFARGRPPEAGLVSVGPLQVALENEHYRVTLSRRRGGLISHLWVRRGGAMTEIPVLSADVYTDWGLCERGVYVSAGADATPRLQVARSGDGTEVTFRGLLQTPPWNGVQRGFPAQPPARYRITYRIDRSPALHVTFGLTPETDHGETQAFFAYVLSLGGVTDWFARTGSGLITGRPGRRTGERVFETKRTGLAADEPEMGIRTARGEIAVRPMKAGGLPQNAFLVDNGIGRLALYLAMLDGGKVALPAGVERTTSVNLVLR